MEIRDARIEDAPAACEVLTRSITELCVVDHRNDPMILARWLSSKTPEIVASWIGQSDNSLLLAVEGGLVLAVGSVTDAGKITLNYVSSDARFRGVSKALLRALEARAAERGNTQCTLTSTETPPLLSCQRLCRGRPTGRRIRHHFKLSDVKVSSTAKFLTYAQELLLGAPQRYPWPNCSTNADHRCQTSSILSTAVWTMISFEVGSTQMCWPLAPASANWRRAPGSSHRK